jgi:hypothetical protein
MPVVLFKINAKRGTILYMHSPSIISIFHAVVLVKMTEHVFPEMVIGAKSSR